MGFMEMSQLLALTMGLAGVERIFKVLKCEMMPPYVPRERVWRSKFEEIVPVLLYLHYKKILESIWN